MDLNYNILASFDATKAKEAAKERARVEALRLRLKAVIEDLTFTCDNFELPTSSTFSRDVSTSSSNDGCLPNINFLVKGGFN